MQTRLQEKVLGTIMLYSTNPPTPIAKAVLPANLANVIQIHLVSGQVLPDHQQVIAEINDYLLTENAYFNPFGDKISLKRGEAAEATQAAVLSLLIGDYTNYRMGLEITK